MRLNLNSLNPQQRQAVLYGDGPLLILAGAGSGKTSTMTYRIAHLVAERRVPARNILGLSFTNKAAGELKERVGKLIAETSGRAATRGLTITTFHSLCVRVLRNHGDRLGFQRDFSILDQNDQRDVLREVLRNIRIDERKFDVDQILFQIGQAKNRFLSGDQAEEYFLQAHPSASDYAIATASSYGRYQDQLKVLNAMDFDDLLFNAVKLLAEFPEVRSHYNDLYRYLLVDEYQDTNPAQFRLLRLLTEKQANLCVVGDDDQSIYGWRGADSAHILEFGNQFPSAHKIILDQNYRSTSTILDAANNVIAQNRHRFPKSLWSDRGLGEPLSEVILEEDRDEAEFVADELLKRAKEQNRPWKDFAVLYRSNPQSRIFEEALRTRQIPYKLVGTLSFLDRKEVKNVLSYWKLIVNPKDDASLRRILNWPARGIGKTSIETMATAAFAKAQPIFDELHIADQIAPKARSASVGFRETILNLRARLESTSLEAEALSLWAKSSLETLGVKKALEDECDDPVQFAKRWDNVEELVHSLGQFFRNFSHTHSAPESATDAMTPVFILREFLARMTLEAQEEEEKDKDKDQNENKNEVTLLTLHGAKGLEYPVVFLVGMEEGFIPHRRTLEEAQDLSEERRLCYVGITRARDHLILTRAKNRIRYGKKVPREPSRFMKDIPQNLLITRDASSTPDLSSPEKRQEHEDKVKNFLADIRARLISPP